MRTWSEQQSFDENFSLRFSSEIFFFQFRYLLLKAKLVRKSILWALHGSTKNFLMLLSYSFFGLALKEVFISLSLFFSLSPAHSLTSFLRGNFFNKHITLQKFFCVFNKIFFLNFFSFVAGSYSLLLPLPFFISPPLRPLSAVSGVGKYLTTVMFFGCWLPVDKHRAWGVWVKERETKENIKIVHVWVKVFNWKPIKRFIECLPKFEAHKMRKCLPLTTRFQFHYVSGKQCADGRVITRSSSERDQPIA